MPALSVMYFVGAMPLSVNSRPGSPHTDYDVDRCRHQDGRHRNECPVPYFVHHAPRHAVKFYRIQIPKNSMKTKLAIAAGIIFALVFVSVSFSHPVEDYGPDPGQKYQYKFWQQALEFENGNWLNRVLFSYSHDYGRAFSEPVDMSMTNLSAHEPKMIVMGYDVILVWRAEQPEPGDDGNLFFARSTDHGETFDAKPVFFGGRPDIKYYDDGLYLVWLGGDFREIWYSDSFDRGKTFSEPVMLFEIDWELSPYEPKPFPELEVYSDRTVVSWKMQNNDGSSTWIVWDAVDQGKDGTFEITRSISDE